MQQEELRALRNAFGSFMTGVTVVTARTAAGDPVGFTANSFSSVSLDPPLLLVCPSKSMSMYQAFRAASHFCINILSADQREVSNTFAAPCDDRFAQTDWVDNEFGVPRIQGSIAYFDCRQYEFHEAGDHGILIGEVLTFEDLGGEGLGYHRGSYFSFEMEREAQRLAAQVEKLNAGVIAKQGDKVCLLEESNGYSLPSVQVASEECAYTKLTEFLEKEYQISIEAGEVYSVFDRPDSERAIYYRVLLESIGDLSDHAKIEWVPLKSLSDLNFLYDDEASMLSRFIEESQTGNHRLYVGSDSSGVVQQARGSRV